ncbi:MAG: serine hydrolase [Stigonema ocellatum SAG 48.90 = DSM 106950]|nr:serine hydrolase [Stigonema ocellatum SAG 48.90 = DSM 106950]
MATRASITGFWRRQPAKGHQPPPRKVKKLGHNQAKFATEPLRASYKVNPPPNTATPIKRAGVGVPVMKPMTTEKRKIPPFNPNAVQGKIPPFNPNTVNVKKVRMRKQRKQELPKKISHSRKTRLKPMAKTMLYALRLLIVGVGIGAIVGTLLSVLDPATRIATSGSPSNTTVEQAQPQPTPNTGSSLFLSQENISLKTAMQNLLVSTPNLTPGVFFVDLDSGAYVDINASSTFAAASTIKLPVIIAFFQDVDAGKIRLDETLTLRREMVVGGSGDMQYKRVGTQFSLLDVATKMITISDNTAANMLIDRLGGMEVLNQRFQSWGLTNTAIRNHLPDLQGTNSTSPKDLGSLMAMVIKGNVLSMPSRDRLLDIMRHTVRNQLLPSGLGGGATIAHKTGDISTMLADAGLVDMPTGKRYIISVMVQRPNNDPRAERLISSISRAAYQQFSPTAAIPSSTVRTIPMPATGYPPTIINPAFPNGTGSTIPMPVTGYPPTMINPALPNGTGSTVPMPVTGYPPTVMNQQYYYPYQR